MAGPGQDHAFAREEVFPSWFANRLQDMLSAGKFDLVLSRKNATTIQVVPDAILGIAAVNIKGRWRFNTAATERPVSGSKGTYNIWAVAEDNSVNNTPVPFTDHTVYTFELRVSVAEPSVGAGTAINQKIGEVDWSGTEIEAIRQNRGAITGAQIADAALGASGPIEWKREPSGALVPQVKATAAQLLIGQSTGLALAKAMTGDISISEAGVTQVGSGKIFEANLATALIEKLQAGTVAKHIYVTGENARTNAAFGSFATPIKIELPKVLPSQIVEILAVGYGKASIESSAAAGGVFGLNIGGSVVQETRMGTAGAEVASNTIRQFATTGVGLFKNTPPNSGQPTVVAPHEILGVGGKAGGQEPTSQIATAPGWALWTPSAEKTNLAIEIVGKCSSGTITAVNWLLVVRVTG